MRKILSIDGGGTRGLIPALGVAKDDGSGRPRYSAKDWGKARWLAPLLSCMFDGAADAANYQVNMFLGSRYARMQTRLSVASDDMDNATNGNVENLKAELETVCTFHLTLKT